MTDTMSRQETLSTTTPSLIAYRLQANPALQIVPAGREREWINQTSQQFAKRCLPLMLANQAGWWILNSQRLAATWNGGADKDALSIQWEDDAVSRPAVSHFGHGILTWHIPYLLRTSPGWNLLARGPANWPKPGAAALEGIIETDWTVATFTMNWKLTVVDEPVTWLAGEPICQLVPQRRGELETFSPEVRDLSSAPELQEEFASWSRSRREFLSDLLQPDSAAAKARWQRDYFQGRTPAGTRAPEHETKLRLRPFVDGEAGDDQPGEV